MLPGCGSKAVPLRVKNLGVLEDTIDPTTCGTLRPKQIEVFNHYKFGARAALVDQHGHFIIHYPYRNGDNVRQLFEEHVDPEWGSVSQECAHSILYHYLSMFFTLFFYMLACLLFD